MLLFCKHGHKIGPHLRPPEKENMVHLEGMNKAQ